MESKWKDKTRAENALNTRCIVPLKHSLEHVLGQLRDPLDL